MLASIRYFSHQANHELTSSYLKENWGWLETGFYYHNSGHQFASIGYHNITIAKLIEIWERSNIAKKKSDGANKTQAVRWSKHVGNKPD